MTLAHDSHCLRKVFEMGSVSGLPSIKSIMGCWRRRFRFCERLGVKLPRPTYQSGANTAAVRGLIADSGVSIELRQSKYLTDAIDKRFRCLPSRKTVFVCLVVGLSRLASRAGDDNPYVGLLLDGLRRATPRRARRQVVPQMETKSSRLRRCRSGSMRNTP